MLPLHFKIYFERNVFNQHFCFNFLFRYIVVLNIKLFKYFTSLAACIKSPKIISTKYKVLLLKYLILFGISIIILWLYYRCIIFT